MGLISDSADILGRVVKLTRHGGLFQSNPRLWSGLLKMTRKRTIVILFSEVVKEHGNSTLSYI